MLFYLGIDRYGYLSMSLRNMIYMGKDPRAFNNF